MNTNSVRIATTEDIDFIHKTILKDSFKKSPKSVKFFIEDDELTPDKLFCSTKAKGAYWLRNTTNYCGYLSNSIKNFLTVAFWDNSPSSKIFFTCKLTLFFVV